jgi:hypothetical protein
MRKWIIRASCAFTVLFVAWVVYIAFNAWYWQGTIGASLEQELGFQHGSPYIWEDGSSQPREVLTVESVVPNGIFDQAGFQRGNVIQGVSTNELFRLLHRGRGQQVTFRVVDGGNGPPLSKRPERLITVSVPAMPKP